jgi:hypothetical protein
MSPTTAKRRSAAEECKQAADDQNGDIVALTKDPFQAAIALCGSVEPANYKRYVLPVIVLRLFSLRYDELRRH